MKKAIFILALAVSLLFSVGQVVFAQDHFCTLYFTFIGCPNCAVTDPIVLDNWQRKYPYLVTIEYGWQGGDITCDNAKFFSEFTKKYKVQAGVPQFVISKDNIRLGRIDVPRAEADIQTKKFNPCLLLDRTVSFEDLDLTNLQGLPKIWANGRVLIRLDKNTWLFQWNGDNPPKTLGKEGFTQKEMKELLFSDDLVGLLKNKVFDVVEPQEVKFSGSAFPKKSGFVSSVRFGSAIRIRLSSRSIPPPSSPSSSLTESESVPHSNVAAQPASTSIIELPVIGKIRTKGISLSLLTILIALADGFNPCAFFVLTFLLAALIGLAGARKKIILVGGIFIFFSGLFYFLFMSVLLNVFQIGDKVKILTILAGLIAVFAGFVNIKDYFAFQKGISLTLPKNYKEKFIQRVNNLSLTDSLWGLAIGATVIACTVNIYELLCTFGFPMVYTRVLTLRELSRIEYYLYLIFYNLVYVLPLIIIVLFFAITLGKKTFNQLWVRRLKLVSGFMILFLGLILIFRPNLLENILTAFGSLFLALMVSLLVVLFYELLMKNLPDKNGSSRQKS